MGYLKFENENLFIEKKNKIILTEYNMFFKFMKYLYGIEQGNLQVEYNGLILNNKNTLIIDLSSITSLTLIFSNENRIIDEYTKYNLEKLNISLEDETIMNETIKKYAKELFNNLCCEEFEINWTKLLKSYSQIIIKNSSDLIKVISSILENDNLKELIILYKRSILKEFKLYEIEEFVNDKVHLFEICDKESYLEINDNILIFDKEITQIRVDDFLDLILEKSKIYQNENKDTYSNLISKILFYTINRKEVDLMMKYKDEISELVKILDEEFKINLSNVHGYI